MLGESGQHRSEIEHVESPRGGDVLKRLGRRRREAGYGLDAAALTKRDGEEGIRGREAEVTSREVEAEVLGLVGWRVQAHVLTQGRSRRIPCVANGTFPGFLDASVEV